MFADEHLVFKERLDSKVANILGVSFAEVSAESKKNFVILSYKVAEKEFVFWIRESEKSTILDVGSKNLDGKFSVVNSRNLSEEESKQIFDLIRDNEIFSLPELGENKDISENYYVYSAGKIGNHLQPKFIIRDIFESRVFDQLMTKVWLLAHRKGTGWRVVDRN